MIRHIDEQRSELEKIKYLEFSYCLFKIYLLTKAASSATSAASVTFDTFAVLRERYEYVPQV